MRIIIFHIRLKVVFAKSILIQQLSFLFPKFFCFFLLRVFQLLFNFLILLRSFNLLQLFQFRTNNGIIDLSTNLKAFFKAVRLPLFQFKRQREATSICATPFHARPLPFLCFSTPLYRIFRTFSSKNSKFDIHPLFFCCTALFVFVLFVHLFAISFILFRKRIKL